MGNCHCQAAEAATVVIQHPGGKVERAYWSLAASRVMASHPGHYVAVVIVTAAPPPYSAASIAAQRRRSSRDTHVKHLKLLRPDDTLHVGRVYRLVSFEEVLREFASKKHVELGRLLVKHKEKHSSTGNDRDGGGASFVAEGRRDGGGDATEFFFQQSQDQEVEAGADAELEEDDLVHGTTTAKSTRAKPSRHGQYWKPSLQSIAEDGSST